MPRKTKGDAMSAALNLSIVDQMNAANAEDEANNKPQQSGFQIDDDIAIPEGRAARQSAYPFDKLSVGQSFFVPPVEGLEQNKLLARLNQACFNRNKKGDARFIARKWTGENGQAGVRVWRQK